jgi:glutamine synthetase adenylyltransferase
MLNKTLLSSVAALAMLLTAMPAKAEVSLLLGLADLGGWWHCEKVTAALSDFADAALRAACDHLILALADGGKVDAVSDRPEASFTGFPEHAVIECARTG